MSPWVFWIGAALAADALIGLIGLGYWQRLWPRLPIGKLAAAEGVLALALMLLYLLGR